MRSEAVNLNICDIERRFGVVSKEPAVCPEHGEYAAIITKHRPEPSGCPTCAELRAQELQRIEQKAHAAKVAQERVERRLGQAMIPPRFQGKDFSTYIVGGPKQQKNLDACKSYAKQFPEHYKAGRCLLLLGKVGTGKTHLASAICGAVVVNHGMVAVYRTVTGVLQFIKGSYDNRAEYSEADAFEALIEPHLLVIDEAGATKPTEFEMTAMFTLINGRYEQQKPTVLISNLMPEELPAVIGERCVDRLREGGGIALVFDWESARGKRP